MAAPSPKVPLFAVGHSTRPIEDFIAMLKAHGVTLVADVRTVPQSRFNPQFGREALSKSLARAGLEYVHMKELGGLRRPRPDSKNTVWRNSGFRGYADYMETPEFERGLDALVDRARADTVAFLCSEGNPFRCHRTLLADALAARGLRVEHIASARSSKPHRLTPFARIARGKVVYRETPDLFDAAPPKNAAKPAKPLRAKIKRRKTAAGERKKT